MNSEDINQDVIRELRKQGRSHEANELLKQYHRYLKRNVINAKKSIHYEENKERAERNRQQGLCACGRETKSTKTKCAYCIRSNKLSNMRKYLKQRGVKVPISVDELKETAEELLYLNRTGVSNALLEFLKNNAGTAYSVVEVYTYFNDNISKIGPGRLQPYAKSSIGNNLIKLAKNGKIKRKGSYFYLEKKDAPHCGYVVK